MLKISQAEAQDLQTRLSGALARVKSVRASATEAVEKTVETLEIGAVAFGLGVVQGRFQGVELLGLPVDLIAALGAHGLALAGVAPRHLHAVGDGALASYAVTLGAGIGAKMRETSTTNAAALPPPAP